MFRVVSRRSPVLLAADICVIYASLFLAASISFLNVGNEVLTAYFVLVLSFYIPALYVFDCYSPFRTFEFSKIGVSLFLMASAVTAVLLFLVRVMGWMEGGEPVLLVANIFIYAGLVLVRIFYDVLFCSPIMRLRAVVVGDGVWLTEIIQLLAKTKASGYMVVGVVVPSGDVIPQNMPEGALLGTLGDIGQIVVHSRADAVILAMEEKTRGLEDAVIGGIPREKTRILGALGLYERLTGQVPFYFFRGGQLLALSDLIRDNYYMMLKRGMDVAGACLIGLFFSPFVLCAVILLAIEFRGVSRVFLLQERVGKNGKVFRMHKLRTMHDLSDGRKLVAATGRWIRRYRIDEVPQVINILKGEMSLIGPRPEMQEFVSYCSSSIPFYSVIFSVRPGLTGWAQVRFPHTSRKEDYRIKFCYDLYYLKHCSLVLDMIILLETVKTVLFGRGK